MSYSRIIQIANKRPIFSNNLSNLIISDLRVWVHLGCSIQERHHAQCVSFDICITFSKNPKATASDDLNDGFCYAKAIDLIKEAAGSKNYNMIEHLAAYVHNILNTSLEQKGFSDASLAVTVVKLSPPVPDIHGGVSFTYYG